MGHLSVLRWERRFLHFASLRVLAALAKTTAVDELCV
jgi:hypothetical protein